MNKKSGLITLLLICAGPAVVLADETSETAIDSGDTAFILLASALVLLMTPGLAFFYGGLVRRKNILSVLFQCFILMCALTMQWIFFGYSLSFGSDIMGGLIGGLEFAGLRGVGLEPTEGSTIPICCLWFSRGCSP